MIKLARILNEGPTEESDTEVGVDDIFHQDLDSVNSDGEYECDIRGGALSNLDIEQLITNQNGVYYYVK